ESGCRAPGPLPFLLPRSVESGTAPAAPGARRAQLAEPAQAHAGLDAGAVESQGLAGQRYPGTRPAGRADQPDAAVFTGLPAHHRRSCGSSAGGLSGADAGDTTPQTGRAD